MRKITQKKSPLNLVLNSLKPHETDPTLLECKFTILDFDVSKNNTLITKETALGTLSKSIINKPIRAYYIEDKDDFGGHEAELKENKDGEKVFERNTVPMGTFVSEGYVESIEIDGELKEVLCADAVLWQSQFIEPCNLLLKWFNDGVKINMSCEYLYKNYEITDGVEVHNSPIYLEAHCLLGKDVAPSYDSATIINTTQLNEFKTLVAQAVNQDRDKEEYSLEEILEQTTEVKVEVSTDPEFETQLNELSHDDIRSQIREQVKAHILGESFIWVNDVYETYTVIEAEFNEAWKYYRYDYTIENEIVTVDTSTQAEVKSKREWVVVTNEIQAELDKVKSEKDDLTTKFNNASEMIIALNSTIEELKPFQELALNAKREEKLVELNEKFSKAFNNAHATEQFESEVVQTLLNEALDSTEALSQLNSMVVDLVMNLQVKESSEKPLLGLNSVRKNLIDIEEDEYEKLFKL